MHKDNPDGNLPPSYDESVDPSTSSSIRVTASPSVTTGSVNGSEAGATHIRDLSAVPTESTLADDPDVPPAPPARPGADPSRPPPDAQRAIAPFTRHEINNAIKGTYAVTISENKSAPDVNLGSTNGAVRVDIFLVGQVPRPAGVVVQCTNGQVHLKVAREKGQVLDIRAESTNGRIHVRLPRDYAGHVSVRTTNGSASLSPALKEHSVIVPSEGDSKTTTYRIGAPRYNDPGYGTKTHEPENDPDAYPDRCFAKAGNGRILVSYYDEELEDCGGGRCVIM